VTALIVIVWTIIGAVVGMVIGGVIAPAFGYRDMEGMSGIFAVFFIAPIGALAGGFLGLGVARKYAGKREKILGGSLLAIALAVAGGVAFELVTNDTIESPPWLMFEIRLAPGVAAPAEYWHVSGHMRSKGKDGSSLSFGDSFRLAQDGDRVVLKGSVLIYRRTADRYVTFRIGDGPLHLFRLSVPAEPIDSQLGPWSPTDIIEEGATKRAPKAGEAFDIRYRVRK
jgi:hypothetical protein